MDTGHGTYKRQRRVLRTRKRGVLWDGTGYPDERSGYPRRRNESMADRIENKAGRWRMSQKAKVDAIAGLERL